MSSNYRIHLPWVVSGLLLASTTGNTAAADYFGRVASFPVAANLPADAAPDQETSAEIFSASDDGMTLVYSDSPLGGIGFIDISNASNPGPAGFLSLDGEPTSVVMAGFHVTRKMNWS